MYHKLKIEMKISFTSKWHTGSGESSLLIDRLVQRDGRRWPFIPGSTLKGIIRENCEKLSRSLDFAEPSDPHETRLTISDSFHPLVSLQSPVDQIFGTRYQSGDLFFSDARLDSPPPSRFIRNQNRNSIYRILCTAREHQLFSSEYVVPMTFSVHIDGYHRQLVCFEGGPPYAYCLLVAGILCLERLGADKSTGNGNVRIHIISLEYNGKSLGIGSVFEYLDAELYELTKKEMA